MENKRQNGYHRVERAFSGRAALRRVKRSPRRRRGGRTVWQRRRAMCKPTTPSGRRASFAYAVAVRYVKRPLTKSPDAASQNSICVATPTRISTPRRRPPRPRQQTPARATSHGEERHAQPAAEPLRALTNFTLTLGTKPAPEHAPTRRRRAEPPRADLRNEAHRPVSSGRVSRSLKAGRSWVRHPEPASRERASSEAVTAARRRLRASRATPSPRAGSTRHHDHARRPQRLR